MVDTAMEEFHADYQRLFDKESALAFNETLAAFLQDQKLRTFVCALHTLCEGEKAALIPSMKKVLPANLQGPFQNAWDLAQQGIIDAETPDSKVTDDSDHSVLYLGSAGLMAVPSGEKDDMTLLNRVLTQMLEEQVNSQESELRVTADSIQTLDPATGALNPVIAIDNIVFCDFLDIGSIEDDDESAFVIVQQDPIYELVVAHFYSSLKKNSVKILKLVHAGMEKPPTDLEDPFFARKEASMDIGPELSALELRRENLTHNRGLGAGQFGMVYLANYVDPTGQHPVVAVKTLRSESKRDDALEFVHEAEVMQELEHPNVVKVLGVCMQHTPQLLVLEYVVFGNVQQFLQNCITKKYRLTDKEHIHLCHQLALALEYVHAQGIVHMDVAARNALIGSNSVLKLADFGQAQRKDSNGVFVLTRVMRLSVRWMAPESLANIRKEFGERTDVWSFGVTCWEFFMYGRLPFKSLKTAQARDMIMQGKARLNSRPITTCPKPMWRLMESCWDYDAAARPTFAAMAREMQAMLDANSTPVRDIGAELKALTHEVDSAYHRVIPGKEDVPPQLPASSPSVGDDGDC
eukprot:m.41116 g.41116  ORF g.41116 m.41116 type:complete len:578 (+) comp10516_c0_seq2:129-1862(+)